MTLSTKLVTVVALGALIALLPARFEAQPTVYPTGTTIYDPEQTWSGYVILDMPESQGAVLIDMNGNQLRHWESINSVPGPTRILPGGFVVGGHMPRQPHQEAIALIQLDWDGNEVWRYDHTEQVIYKEPKEEEEEEDGAAVAVSEEATEEAAEEDEEEDPGVLMWGSRQHHDWQREGDPAGYFSPQATAKTSNAKTLVMAHKNVHQPQVSDQMLEDDYIVEVNWKGEVLWEWLASDHVDEMGFSEAARNAIYAGEGRDGDRGTFDWLHINSMSYVGPNHWYDEGDQRFHPDNVIVGSRNANFIAIIDRSGAIVWRLGPDYRLSPPMAEIGQIIGQHHPHIIPAGLPGAGNLLVFDNGGSSGYGAASPAAPEGQDVNARHFSRVLEIDPLTLEIVWEYSFEGTETFRFFSSYVSSAQRLPNGNTMITEGADGRVFETTSEGDIVWEFVSPYYGKKNDKRNMIYRAYRVPYDWIPQLDQPTETPVVPPEQKDFRVP